MPRGGTRPNAGRPPSEHKGKPVKFYLYEGELERIKAFIKHIRSIDTAPFLG